MPPNKKCRRCRKWIGGKGFKPMGIPFGELEAVVLHLDELEAMRLCDSEGKDQSEAGEAMGVSRGTVQRLLRSGRRKVIEGFIQNHLFIIEEEPNE